MINYRAKNSKIISFNYTINKNDHYIICNNNDRDIIITLPNNKDFYDKEIYIIKQGTKNVLIATKNTDFYINRENNHSFIMDEKIYAVLLFSSYDKWTLIPYYTTDYIPNIEFYL